MKIFQKPEYNLSNFDIIKSQRCVGNIFSAKICKKLMWRNRYRAFYRFGQAKFPDGGLILGSSKFSILPHLPPKILFDSKVVKTDSKIIISLH